MLNGLFSSIGNGFAQGEDKAFQGYLGSLNGMPTPAAPPTMFGKPSPLLGVGLILADAIARNNGGEVMTPFLQGRQMAMQQEAQRQQQEFQVRQMQHENMQKIAELKYKYAANKNQEYQQGLERARAAKDRSEEKQYGRDTSSYNSASTRFNNTTDKGEVDLAFSQINALAGKGYGFAPVTEEMRQSKYAALASKEIKDLMDVAYKVRGQYGELPAVTAGAIDAKRKQIAKNYFGGDLSMVPEIESAATLKGKLDQLAVETKKLELTYKKEDRKYELSKLKTSAEQNALKLKWAKEDRERDVQGQLKDLLIKGARLSEMKQSYDQNDLMNPQRRSLLGLQIERLQSEINKANIEPINKELQGKINKAMNNISTWEIDLATTTDEGEKTAIKQKIEAAHKLVGVWTDQRDGLLNLPIVGKVPLAATPPAKPGAMKTSRGNTVRIN